MRSFSRLRALSGIALLLSAPTFALGQARPALMQASEVATSPYNLVAYLSSQGFSGSAFVAGGPNVVVTAAHCVYEGGWIPASRIAIDVARHSSSAVNPVAPTSYYNFASFGSLFSSGNYDASVITLDAAALYKTGSPWAGGNYLPISASDAQPHPGITGTYPSTIAGYPAEAPYISPANRGFMHRTPTGNYSFRLLGNQTTAAGTKNYAHVSASVDSYGGNSGGPMLTFFTSNWGVAAIYTGSRGTTEALVRSIDSGVAGLISNAQASANSGGGGGSGGGGSTGNYSLASAVDVNGYSAVLTGSNTASSATNRAVFWKWVAPVSGTLTLNTEGSSFDTTVALLNASGSVLQSNDDGGSGTTSRLTFGVAAGTTYYFRVAGYNGANGTYVLSYSIPGGSGGGTSAPSAGTYLTYAEQSYGAAGTNFSGGNQQLGYYYLAYYYYYIYLYEQASGLTPTSSNMRGFYEYLAISEYIKYANRGELAAAYAWYNYLHEFALRY